MKWILVLLVSVCCAAQSPIEPGRRVWVTELGVSFPLSNTSFKDYLVSSGIGLLPITAGLGTGVEIGRFAELNRQSIVGVVVGGNAFQSWTAPAHSQIYQLSGMFIGKVGFGDTWREGVTMELGAGIEAAAASFFDAAFVYQANVTARVGLGYSFIFNESVTFSGAITTSPTLVLGDILSASRATVSMYW